MIKTYEREMSISLKDFHRLLPIALKTYEYQISDKNTVDVIFINGKLEIIPGIEHERKIASLALPVLYIVFNFIDVSSSDIDSFFDGFMRAYQRGGG